MDIALSHSYRNLEYLNSTDELTNIFNRRKIQETLTLELERAKRYNADLGLILFDIDNFKQINDSVGHNGGDRVLVKLTQTIQKSLRNSDFFGRWGGEEFLVVIPEITKSEAKHLAEKIREIVTQMGCSVVDNLSCSFGVSILNKEQDTLDTLIERAHRAMYKAKELGKNRVEVL
ncbi:MAG: GGDEF domain-containing protein [Campylobacterales bacterium]|nr:GGDEF domain-containing protein [Campylobacterales bacterium]